jgi:hypothetical protein
METTNIYVLIDPRTGHVRYVGKANNITQRYKAHLNRARDHQTHKRNWINSLRNEELKPILWVIDVVPIDEWVFWEKYWISQMKLWGFDLVNNTLGGDGCTFGNNTSFKKGNNAKSVIGYNKEGVIVYEFNSAEDASRELKTHRSVIPKCCLGNCKTVKNIAWFYHDEIKNSDIKELVEARFTKNFKSNSNSFKIGQISLRSKKVTIKNIITNEITILESGAEAARVIGVSQSSIVFAIKNNKLIKKTFKIDFYEDKKK